MLAINNTNNIYNKSYSTVKYNTDEDIISVMAIIFISILKPNLSSNIPHIKRPVPFIAPNNMPKTKIDD